MAMSGSRGLAGCRAVVSAVSSLVLVRSGQVRSGREAVVIGKCIKDKTARVDDMAGHRPMCNRATAATPRIWKELKEACSS